MTPHRKRQLHGALTVAWALLLIPGLLVWRESVPFLVAVSIYANIGAHWSAYEASTPMEVEDVGP